MLPSFLSPVNLYNAYLRRCFSASGLTSQTVTLTDSHQTTVHFWGPDPTRRARKKKKPALVLIHGFGPVATWQWRSQVQFFSPSFDVYVPDLLFFGRSFTESEDRSEAFQAKAVAELMEIVGAEKYSVVGTSYGGIVAYNVAVLWPERVERVVVASSGLNMRKSDRCELLRLAGVAATEDLMLPKSSAQMRKLLSLAVHNQPSVLPDFFLNDMVNKLYTERRKEKIELLKGLTIGRDEETNLSPLNQDVLLIWGDQDKIFPLEMATELQQVLGKKVRLEVIKNAGHVPQTEKSAVFNQILYNFLSESSQ